MTFFTHEVVPNYHNRYFRKKNVVYCQCDANEFISILKITSYNIQIFDPIEIYV